MILQSQLFQGDPKLEAAAISDPAHILPGAWGPHVGKIQMALIQLDGANIAEYELQRQAYGASTAAAVLAFKRKRNIINFSYQTKADDIVGKMTITALDREMKEREVNKIYRDNHAGLEFFKSGVNTGLEIPGLGVDEHGNVLPGVRVSKAAADSRDFQKIRPHFNSNSLFNVFFVGSFIEELDPSNPPAQLFAETSQPPNSDPPLRCCLWRDNRDGDPQRSDFWGETLAHEAGHALGESDDFNNTDSLMFRFRDRVTGTKIDVEMSGRMLASFKQWQRRPPFTIP